MPKRQKVQIEDIEDAEAFVRSLLPRVLMTPDVREELVQIGLVILRNMELRYEPGRGGQDPSTSRFSGFAAKYLPSKLRDAWHRLEGHTSSTDENGKRRWTYPPTTASLDQIQEREGASEHIPALVATDSHEMDIRGRLRHYFEEELEMTLRVADMLIEGASKPVIAQALDVREQEVTSAVKRIEQGILRVSTFEPEAA